MSVIRLTLITALAMLAFAGNSILCRLALSEGLIDAATFTTVRLLSGAVMLALLVLSQRKSVPSGGSWWSAFALFAYAAGFSFAYISLSAATGALLLFGAVQFTMIGYGLWAGERLNKRQVGGAVLAFGGLIGLLLPGLQAPPLVGALLMLGAGVAWGVYSLRGRRARDPLRETAGNFVRTVPLAMALSALFFGGASAEVVGLGLAVVSGALASGVGYALWYSVLPQLNSGAAAIVQLVVPVLAAVGGVVLLSEPLTVRTLVASVAILGGVAIFLFAKHGWRGARRDRAVES